MLWTEEPHSKGRDMIKPRSSLERKSRQSWHCKKVGKIETAPQPQCRAHRQHNALFDPEVIYNDAKIFWAAGGAGTREAIFAPPLLQQLGFLLVSNAQNVGQRLVTIVL